MNFRSSSSATIKAPHHKQYARFHRSRTLGPSARLSVFPSRPGHLAVAIQPPAARGATPTESPEAGDATTAEESCRRRPIFPTHPHPHHRKATRSGQDSPRRRPAPAGETPADAAQHRRRQLPHVHLTHLHSRRRPEVDASYRGRHRSLLISGHSCRQGHRQPRRRFQQLRQHRLQRSPLQLHRRLGDHVRNRPLQPQ